MILGNKLMMVTVATIGFNCFLVNNLNAAGKNVRIPDTGQTRCYNTSQIIKYPRTKKAFYGQDAQYQGHLPSYKDNDDGTVSDLVTGLMWSKAVDKTKITLEEAEKRAKKMTLGGYNDWRVPNIKELYSLIDFRGYTGFAGRGNYYQIPKNTVPYINTDYFDFEFGNLAAGERYIDAQWLSTTKYVSTTMDGNKTMFGVNFADGRIKGYPYERVRNGRLKKFYARYVRGNQYGHNNFVDNGDGTVTDKVTGLMWMKNDSGNGMSWQDALKYAEKMKMAGYSDWRLPNAKELQYIVDYTRSPDTSNSAAIHPKFKTTSIKNEAGQVDYPFFWTSTTHLDGPWPGSGACYVAFGRAMGQMWGKTMDVHGAGAQRSDPKTGKAVLGHGPQGDARRVYNFVRCVRGGNVRLVRTSPKENKDEYPYNYRVPQTASSSQRYGMPKGQEQSFSNQRGQYQQHRQQFGQQQQHGKDQQRAEQAGGQMQGRFQYQGQQQHGQFQSHGQQQGQMSHQKMFMQRLDKDNDGKVSQDEFDGPSNHFSHFDKNGDSYITEDEAPLHPPPGRHGRGRKRR